MIFKKAHSIAVISQNPVVLERTQTVLILDLSCYDCYYFDFIFISDKVFYGYWSDDYKTFLFE